ncbi:MAG: hypothetical protein IKD12_06905 [Paludibacteraceae bacterium]|nr:hypothetical protein [Paludibacteraceae bacterium]
MTELQRQHAAEFLLRTKELLGGDDPKFLPKVFVVEGKCYLFLNAARRAAFGTDLPIEVMTIEDAWEISRHMPADTLDTNEVEWNFDQTGSTFDGRLFANFGSIMAGMVPNPIVKAISGKNKSLDILDKEIDQLYLTTRAQNILMKTGCKTYGDALKLGRETISKLRNVGATTISELDAEFDRVGLWNQWKYNKPIK